ncbi:hypothetical protein BESB_068040 [Besnoitia besnoiti]|uniref:Transmembrane protein n=1 Tax=Besnoitia besnoiti TaxID=94643 RepID=A0A2A9MET2_BESBE|nr:hypothetical protein BESB_068040 [Besnoitia besnoiti]PFH34771.1 hypothetical protein BESB_068040 [Besnoitia besnoiti]
MRIQNQLPARTHTSSNWTRWQWPIRLVGVVLGEAEPDITGPSSKCTSFVEQALAIVLFSILLIFLLRKLSVGYRLELTWQRFLGNVADVIAADEVQVSQLQHLIRSELSSPGLCGRLGSRHTSELFRTLQLRPDKIMLQVPAEKAKYREKDIKRL